MFRYHGRNNLFISQLNDTGFSNILALSCNNRTERNSVRSVRLWDCYYAIGSCCCYCAVGGGRAVPLYWVGTQERREVGREYVVCCVPHWPARLPPPSWPLVVLGLGQPCTELLDRRHCSTVVLYVCLFTKSNTLTSPLTIHYHTDTAATAMTGP